MWISAQDSIQLPCMSRRSDGVANDKVFNTVELYFDGLIDKAEAIQRLRFEKPNMQICFRTGQALSCVHFKGSEEI